MTTLRKTLNPRRGIDQGTDQETEMRCLCGKRVRELGGKIVNHRAKLDPEAKNRKARKVSWCKWPERIEKMVAERSVACA